MIQNNYREGIIIILILIIIYMWCQFGKMNSTVQLKQNNEKVNNGEMNEESRQRSRLDGPLPLDNSFLVNLIKEEFVSLPPSKQARDPFPKEMSKESNSQYKQDKTVLKLLDGLKGGFFIECGGNDGVSWSNTLMLELKHDWTGLLVEANPKQYKKLKSLNRHIHSIGSCLSTSPYPEKLQIRSYTGHSGLSGLMSGEGGPHDTWHGKKLEVEDTVTVQCFPLYSILLALGNPTVHYFSLDVEGVELQVLKTVPWEKVDIKILTVEASHSDAQSIQKFMEANNYILHTKLTEDFVFVKKGFKIAQ